LSWHELILETINREKAEEKEKKFSLTDAEKAWGYQKAEHRPGAESNNAQ
jgi:hypothetical protein